MIPSAADARDAQETAACPAAAGLMGAIADRQIPPIFNRWLQSNHNYICGIWIS